jgi:hypothetical protein
MKTKSDNMTITQTQERVSNKQTQIAKVTVPEQSLKPVKDAYATVKALGEDLRLGTFTETVCDTQLLINNRGNLLAVDSKDLPKNKKGEYQEGWFQIIRADGEISYKSISEKESKAFRTEEHWQDVLYVDSSAVKAANEKRPIALGVVGWDRRCLLADGWPNDVARVALVKGAKPEPKLVDVNSETMTSMLRQVSPANEAVRSLTGFVTEQYLGPIRELVNSAIALRNEQENKE